MNFNISSNYNIVINFQTPFPEQKNSFYEDEIKKNDSKQIIEEIDPEQFIDTESETDEEDWSNGIPFHPFKG